MAVLPRPAIEAAMNDISDEKARLDALLDRLRPEDGERPTPADLEPLRGRWKRMTKSEKNAALRLYVRRVDVIEDGAAARITTTWGDSSVLSL